MGNTPSPVFPSDKNDAPTPCKSSRSCRCRLCSRLFLLCAQYKLSQRTQKVVGCLRGKSEIRRARNSKFEIRINEGKCDFSQLRPLSRSNFENSDCFLVRISLYCRPFPLAVIILAYEKHLPVVLFPIGSVDGASVCVQGAGKSRSTRAARADHENAQPNRPGNAH